MMAEQQNWREFSTLHGLEVGDEVTIGPLDDEGIEFFRACGFKVEDGKAKAVVTAKGVGKPSKR
jgi:hypothetical protein